MQIGVSQRSDIVARQGQPSRVWRDADGGSTLEYAAQPFGETCFIYKLDTAGRLVDFRDALTRGMREQVQPGMTTDQVSRLFGHERQRVFFRVSGEDVWDWSLKCRSGATQSAVSSHRCGDHRSCQFLRRVPRPAAERMNRQAS